MNTILTHRSIFVIIIGLATVSFVAAKPTPAVEAAAVRQAVQFGLAPDEARAAVAALSGALASPGGDAALADKTAELARAQNRQAPALAAAAATLHPKAAAQVAVAAAEASRRQAPDIAAAVASVVPASAVRIASMVARKVPSAAVRLTYEVARAVPTSVGATSIHSARLSGLEGAVAGAVPQANPQSLVSAAHRGSVKGLAAKGD